MPMWSRTRRNRRKERERHWRLPALDWRRLSLATGSLAGLAASAGAIVWALDQPIERVTVEGRFQRVSLLEVERAVKQRVRGAGLVTVDLEEVRQSIDRLPWVDAVSVQRQWPRGLRVTVREQVAVARWGATGLLNERGELFLSEARHVPPELPMLSGPQGAESAVARRYLELQGRLVEGGMHLTALRLDERGAWELDLDSGVTVRFGRRDFAGRFERFCASAQKILAERASDVAYVDMRYANGFAIGWRQGGTRLAGAAEDGNDDG